MGIMGYCILPSTVSYGESKRLFQGHTDDTKVVVCLSSIILKKKHLQFKFGSYIYCLYHLEVVQIVLCSKNQSKVKITKTHRILEFRHNGLMMMMMMMMKLPILVCAVKLETQFCLPHQNHELKPISRRKRKTAPKPMKSVRSVYGERLW